MNEMFDSAIRSKGDMAGVYECDGQTSFFYLYQISAKGENKIVGAINVAVEGADIQSSDINILWSSNERIVGLRIQDEIRAAFDCDSALPLVGGTQNQGESNLPLGVVWIVYQ